MNSLVPQKVNITHALQSNVIEKIKDDIKQYQSTSELTQEQMEVVDNYINSLDSAFTQFCMDNDHVEKRKDGVTNADVELFEGLKRMYLTYMNQLSEIKKEGMEKDQEVSKDSPIEYMKEELPYLQASDRYEYVKNLVESSDLAFTKDGDVLKTVQNLAMIDSSLKQNLQQYERLLSKLGYDEQDIKNVLPHESDNKETILPPEKLLETEQPDQDSDNTEEKKKISFSKYLKKDAKDQNENTNNGKRVLPLDSEGQPVVKKAKTGISNNQTLISILKNDVKKKAKSVGGIKFVDDSHLVTIFGDDLPSDGLIASPKQLKKILKPFKEGEPAEFILQGWKGKGAQALIIEIKGVSNSDITQIKNGPVRVSTHVPPSLTHDFTAFNPDLNRPALEPVRMDDDDDMKNKRKHRSPIVARAFGKNSLLLRKDRGGLPYKRVPEVRPNPYPLRPDNVTVDENAVTR